MTNESIEPHSNGEAKDIREAQEHLSRRSIRLALVRILILSIFAITLSNTVEKLNSDDIADKLCFIDKISKDAYVDLPTLPPYLSYLKQTVERSPKPCSKRIANVSSPIDSTDLDQEEAKDEIDKSLKEIEVLLREQSTNNFTPLGFNIKADLRHWLYVLPFFLILSELYIFILRDKAKILSIEAVRPHRDAEAGGREPARQELHLSRCGA